MEKAKDLLLSYVEKAEKIIIELNFNEENAIKLLDELKEKLAMRIVTDEQELYDVCVYNALATIRTSPQQERKNAQLIAAITDAKEEMKAIIEFL